MGPFCCIGTGLDIGQSYYFIADLLGGDSAEAGLEIKTCKGLSYTLFPD